MKWMSCLALATLALGVSVALAGDVKSGLQAGAKTGPFTVTKYAGADADGVKVGDELCYRCKYGSRPQVMVFARSTSGSVADLAKQLNAAVTENQTKQLSAFINVLGTDKAAAEKSAKALADTAKTDKVPVVVPVENENGPADYGINPDAEVTVIVANRGVVVASQGFASGKFDKAAVASVLDDVKSTLK
jgi:hypothetical protein